MKIKIDNSRVKVRPDPVFTNYKGIAVKKDLASREKHAAGGGLDKISAKNVIAMQRGGPKAKFMRKKRLLRKKLPTRSRVNRHKTIN